MLTKLRIKNFKSWQDTGEMRMAPLTMYFGANSSGKSSILQFLLMLQQSKYSGDILNFGYDDDDFVELGNFRDIVFNHNKKLAVDFSFSMHDSKEIFFVSVKEKKEELEICYCKSVDISGNQEECDFCDIMHECFFDDDKFVYIGPLRKFPKRFYQWKNSTPYNVGKEGERTVEAIIASKKHQVINIEKMLTASLKKIGLIESFKVKSISENTRDYYQVWVKKTKNSAEVLLTDVGFGVSQILPVLTSLFSSKPNSTIILEQPEIHLHPKAQAELADVIIEAINTRNIQVIIESHSEHLLSRIQSRIADGTFAKDKASLYFCKNETGASELEELKINDGGDIENWPVDFFGDMLGETANRVISYLERKEKNKKSK